MMKAQFRIAFIALMIALVVALALVASTHAQAGACCTAFRVDHSTNSQFSSHVVVPPQYIDAKVLLANVSQTQTVPTGAGWIVFSANCNFYAQTGAAAAVPLASISNGSSPQMNPSAWNITGITQITVISDTACVVTLAFYN